MCPLDTSKDVSLYIYESNRGLVKVVVVVVPYDGMSYLEDQICAKVRRT